MGNTQVTQERLEKYVNPLINLKQLQKLAKQVYFEYPFLEEIFESLIITDNDRDNIIVYANSSFSKVSGYQRNEIIGKNCRFLQGKHTDQKTVDKLRYSIKEGVPVDVELLNYRKDGLPFWNNLLMLPVHKHGRTGKVMFFIGIQKDITSLKYDTDPKKWTPPEVAAWLSKVDCENYSKSFIINSVNGERLFKMDFDFVEDQNEKSKLIKLVTKLKENPIDFFDEEKKKLATANIAWRKNGEFPTAEQIQNSQIWRKKVHLALPSIEKGSKAGFANTRHMMLTSRLPGKYGEIENVRFVGSGFTAVTFKNENIYGIYDPSTNSWRDIAMSKDKRTCNSTHFPYFVSLHYENDKDDLGELVVYNVQTSVSTKYKLWTDAHHPVSGLFAGETYMYIVTESNLFRRKYFDNTNEQVKLGSNIKFPSRCGPLSTLHGSELFLVSGNKKSIQLWDVDTGKCIANIEDLEEPVAQAVCKKTTIVATTKNHLLAWTEPKHELITFPHSFITSIFILDDGRVVVGDLSSTLTLYDLNTKSKLVLNTTSQVQQEGDIFRKMNRGVYSIAEFGKGYIICGTEKSIDIWDLEVAEQVHPLATLKSDGPIIQISPDPNDRHTYKFLERGDIYQIITWTPEKIAPKGGEISFDDDDVSEINISYNEEHTQSHSTSVEKKGNSTPNKSKTSGKQFSIEQSSGDVGEKTPHKKEKKEKKE